MNSHAPLMFLRRMLFCVLAFLAVGSLSAYGPPFIHNGVGTVAGVSEGGQSSSLSITWSGAVATITWTYSSTVDNVEYFGSPSDGIGVETEHTDYMFGAFGPGHSGSSVVYTGTFTSGALYYMAVQVGDGAGHIQRSFTWFYGGGGGAPTYGIKFHVSATPTAADGGTVRHFEIRNASGEVVSEFTTLPGDAASDVYLGGQDTAGDLTLFEVDGYPTQVHDDATNTDTLIFKPTGYFQVGTGTPTVETSGTVSSSPATVSSSGQSHPNSPNAVKPVAPVVAPVTTTAPSAPSTTTSITLNTHDTLTTPSGTGGVTKADSETIGNQITKAIHEADDKNVAGHNNTKDAVDKAAKAVSDNGTASIAAIDKVTSAIKEGSTKGIEGNTALQSLITDSNGYFKSHDDRLKAINTGIGTLHTDLSGMATTLGNISNKLGPTYTDAQTAATAANGTAASSSAAAVTAIGAVMPGTAPTGLGYTVVTSGNGDFMSITLPATFGGNLPGVTAVNFNPFSEGRMAGLASFLRAATQWALLCMLGYYIFTQTKGTMQAAATTQQAKGNTIAAGTGGQATSLIAAGLITAAFVALASALFAWGFDGITAGALISNFTTNPLATVPANIIWVIDQVFPVTTAISCFVARVSFPLYSQALFATYATVVRWVVP